MRAYEYVQDLEGKLSAIGEVRDKDTNLLVSELYAENMGELAYALDLLYKHMED